MMRTGVIRVREVRQASLRYIPDCIECRMEFLTRSSDPGKWGEQWFFDFRSNSPATYAERSMEAVGKLVAKWIDLGRPRTIPLQDLSAFGGWGRLLKIKVSPIGAVTIEQDKSSRPQ